MMDWNRLVSSTPVNALAARQTARGQAWDPSVKITDWLENKPLMHPESIIAPLRADGNFVDFTGVEFGRLVVLGLMNRDADNAGNYPGKWVCRCRCGYFCTRSSKSLKVAARGGNTFVDRCGRCNYQRRLATGWTPQKNSRMTPA